VSCIGDQPSQSDSRILCERLTIFAPSTAARKHGQPAHRGRSDSEPPRHGSLGPCRPNWTCHKRDRLTGNRCRYLRQGVWSSTRVIALSQDEGILAGKVHVETLAGPGRIVSTGLAAMGAIAVPLESTRSPPGSNDAISRPVFLISRVRSSARRPLPGRSGIRSPTVVLVDQGYDHASDDDKTVDLCEGSGHTTQPDAASDAQQDRQNLHGIRPPTKNPWNVTLESEHQGCRRQSGSACWHRAAEPGKSPGRTENFRIRELSDGAPANACRGAMGRV
jgi:hypothetical protein